MNTKKKQILAVILLVLVVILGGASIFVANRLSTQAPVAPNAPESKPQASGETWLQSTNCNLSFNIACTPTAVKTCTPDCPTDCGHVASTITTCTDSCGAATTKACTATAACPTAAVTCDSKVAYKDGTTEVVTDVTKGQTIVIAMVAKNTGASDASNVIFNDTLNGENRELLTFVDSTDGCTFDSTTKIASCSTTVPANSTKKVTFRARVVASAADSTVINNKCSVKLGTAAATECANSVTVKNPNITAVKKAYRDNTNNTANNYQLTEEINSVAKNQTFVYSIDVQNTGNAVATGVVITDPLTGQNQDKLTFIDKVDACTWSAADKLVSCNLTIQPRSSARIAFRTKVSDTVANGDVIKNIGHVVLGSQDITVTKDLNVSTLVGCSNTCSSDSECSNGYVCDTGSSMCRNKNCVIETSCVCPAVVTEAPTTAAPRVITARPTRVVTERVATAAPEALPETGALSLPGVGVFGGGLLLTVIGILFAL